MQNRFGVVQAIPDRKPKTGKKRQPGIATGQCTSRQRVTLMMDHIRTIRLP